MIAFRHQAEMLPVVLRAVVDESKLNISTKPLDTFTDTGNNMSSLPICQESCLPDDQWERDILDAFSELRVFIHRQSQLEMSKVRKVLVPPMKNETAWQAFCFGKDYRFHDNTNSSNGNSSNESRNEGEEEVKRRKIELSNMLGLTTAIDGECDINGEVDQDEEDDEKKSDTDIIETTDTIATTVKATASATSEWEGPVDVAPTVALLLQFDQVMTQRLLSHHIHWLIECG